MLESSLVFLQLLLFLPSISPEVPMAVVSVLGAMHWSVLAAFGLLDPEEGGCFSAPQFPAPSANS